MYSFFKICRRKSHFFPSLPLTIYNTPYKTNNEMIDVMQQFGMLATKEIAACLRATDRKFYCKDKPYQINTNKLDQMYGRLEAPCHCAYALALLQKHLHNGGSVLHIGLESGYFTACLARLSKIVGSKKGQIVRLIDNPEIMKIAGHNIAVDDAGLVKSGRIALVERLDVNTDSRFNAIYIHKDLDVIPKTLLQQLTADGRLVYAVDHENNRVLMDSIRSGYFKNTFDGELLAAAFIVIDKNAGKENGWDSKFLTFFNYEEIM